MEPRSKLTCDQVLGGTGPCDLSTRLAGVRGECWSAPHAGSRAGGDIYFLSICGDNVLSKAVVADVAGHGEKVADAARIIHDAVLASRDEHDNAAMLSVVNREFLRRWTGQLRFTTIAATTFDSRDRSLVYAYGGHPAIIVGRQSTGRFSPIAPDPRSARGIPLGIMPDARYTEARTTLAAGDVIVLYTDAFIDARDAGGEPLGVDGFARVLGEAGTLDAASLKKAVLARLAPALRDDATLLVLEVL